jgi:hypothetical protein
MIFLRKKVMLLPTPFSSSWLTVNILSSSSKTHHSKRSQANKQNVINVGHDGCPRCSGQERLLLTKGESKLLSEKSFQAQKPLFCSQALPWQVALDDKWLTFKVY